MELILLPRLKPTAAIRNELYDVIELYVECVAGRRMPRAHGLFAAEKRPAYRSGAAAHV
jgi:hypothetical protein